MDPSRSLALCYRAFLRNGGRRIRNIHNSHDNWANHRFVKRTMNCQPLSRLISTHTALSNSTRSLSLASCYWQKPPHGHRHFSTADKASDDGDNDVDANSTTPPPPWRVAIVGSGPSGCYTAKYLLAGASKLPHEFSSTLQIDVLERLPTPYGLVRNGVAPDHPEVKNVQHDFDALFENSDASINFYGNVTVGGKNEPYDSIMERGLETHSDDVALEELRELYDIVVLAYGCESDRELQLPVEIVEEDGAAIINHQDTPNVSAVRGILSARQFVNWYNGHPDYDWVKAHVEYALLQNNNTKKTSQSIVVVGHGNVALDCARILAKSRTALDPTDLTSRALNVLRPNDDTENENSNTNSNANPIRRSISVVGRRGHVQAAFTIKEVRELTKLSDATLHVRTDELELGTSTKASQEELQARPRARIHKLLEGHSQKQPPPQQQPNNADSNSEPKESPSTEVHLRFLANPVRFQAKNEPDSLRLCGVVCERTKLEGETPQRAVGTGSTEIINADLCLVSIGYKGLPIDATTSASFDSQKGILPNHRGRVKVTSDDDQENNKNNTHPLAPLYVSGWLKRGPSGIIGTNIGDAKDTVSSILKDLQSGAIQKSPKSSSCLKELLQERKVRFVDWEAYRRIEACESSETHSENSLGHHKRHPDQPREKIVDREDLLRAANV